MCNRCSRHAILSQRLRLVSYAGLNIDHDDQVSARKRTPGRKRRIALVTDLYTAVWVRQVSPAECACFLPGQARRSLRRSSSLNPPTLPYSSFLFPLPDRYITPLPACRLGAHHQGPGTTATGSRPRAAQQAHRSPEPTGERCEGSIWWDAAGRGSWAADKLREEADNPRACCTLTGGMAPAHVGLRGAGSYSRRS